METPDIHLFANVSSAKVEDLHAAGDSRGWRWWLAQWKQCSHDMVGTRLHSIVFKLNSSQLFLTAEEERPYYNRRIS